MTEIKSYWDLNKEHLSDELLAKLEEQEGKEYNNLTYDDKFPIDKWVYLLPGIGDGVRLRNIFSCIHEQAVIVVTENDHTRIKYALYHTDLSELLKSGRVILIDTDDPVEISSRLSLTHDRFCRGTHVLGPSSMDNMEWQIDMLHKLTEYGIIQNAEVITHIEKCKLICRNLIHNTESYISHAKADVLHNIHTTQNALVISAGPSIAGQLDFIRENQEKFVIITCTTMLKPLMDNGITPHYVTALESHEVAGRFLECVDEIKDYERATKTKFVLDPKVNKATVEHAERIIRNGIVYDAPQISHKTDIVYLANHWIDNLLGLEHKESAYLRGGATVAHLSYFLAEHIGCRKILIAGQDMAFTGGQYYPECVYKAHTWKEEFRDRADIEKRQLWPVEGMDGETVYTEAQLLCYRNEFENIWSATEKEVIDCTIGGAKRVKVETGRLEDCGGMEAAVLNATNGGKDELHAAKIQDVIKMFLTLIEGCETALSIYKQNENSLHDKKCWESSRERLLKLKEEMNDVDLAVLLVEEYSGVLDTLFRWEQTSIACMKTDDKKKRELLFENDVKCKKQTIADAMAIVNLLDELYDRVTSQAVI